MSSPCSFPVGNDDLASRATPELDPRTALQPLNFFDDFSFLLIAFLEQQRPQDPPSPLARDGLISSAASAAAAVTGAITASPDTTTRAVRCREELGALRDLLKQAQGVVEPGSGAGHMDALSQTSLFLIRLKQLLEEQVHHWQARELGIVPAVGNVPASGRLSSTPVAGPLSDGQQQASVPSIVRTSDERVGEEAVTAAATVRSHGRRYTLAEPRRPTAPAPGPSAGATERKGGWSSEATVTAAGERLGGADGYCDACGAATAQDPAVRFHGELLLRLQQHLVQTLASLEATVTAEAARQRVWRGIVTDELADRLQSTFLEELCAILEVLGRPGDVASAVEKRLDVRREAVDVCARIRRALDRAHAPPTRQGPPAAAGRGPSGSIARLIVHEVGERSQERDPRRSSSAPAAQSHPQFSPLHMAADEPPFRAPQRASAPRLEDEVPAGFGVGGSGFPARVVARHIGCYQSILHQRFPSFAGPWALLERTLYFVGSLRSPTPTAPRSPLSSPVTSASAGDEVVVECVRVDGGGARSPREQQQQQQGRASHPAATALTAATSSVLPTRRRTALGTESMPCSTGDCSRHESGDDTPTRPPPAVDRTQEKSTRPPECLRATVQDGVPDESHNLRGTLFPTPARDTESPCPHVRHSPVSPSSPSFSEAFSPSASATFLDAVGAASVAAAPGPSCEGCPRHHAVEDADQSARDIDESLAPPIQALMNRLEPCTLFDTFLNHVRDRRPSPVPRLGLHRRSNSSSADSVGSKASIRTAAHSPSRPRVDDTADATVGGGSATSAGVLRSSSTPLTPLCPRKVPGVASLPKDDRQFRAPLAKPCAAVRSGLPLVSNAAQVVRCSPAEGAHSPLHHWP